MSTSNFQAVFHVAVFHSYFSDKACSCLKYSYGPVTQTLARRFSIGIRKSLNGFGFYINTKGPLGTFLKYVGNVTGQTYFDFNIATTNPAFNYFTASPAGWLGSFVYDSNSPLNTSSDGVVKLIAGHSPVSDADDIGFLRVHFDDIIDRGYSQFAICYEARVTQWQYFIVNNSSVQLRNPYVSGQPDICFTGPEKVTIQTGQQAMLFTSGKNMLPLAEIPEYKFNLLDASSVKDKPQPTAAKVVFKGLPNPDPAQMGTAATGEGIQAISPMYIYI